VPIKIYNTLTRKIQAFKPLSEEEVHMYSCGPTVYDFMHIGNLRAFLFSDLLRRWLEYRNFKVEQVMNVTDVEDKIIVRARRDNIPVKQLTEKYTKLFFDDLAAVRIEPAKFYTRATEHIQEMVALIEALLKKGLAYKADDGIYFSIAKFKGYGKLSKLKLEKLEAGASGRVAADQYEKEQAQDFALWKFWKPDDGDVVWEAPFGKGRPGWHIECSAMAMKYLGESFDVHTGGIDLMFPHHENEIAQGTGATGKPFARYFVHNEHLLVEGQKMSKSLGNIITLRQLVEQGHNPLAFRYFVLSGHYRTQLNFTFEALEQAEDTLIKLNDFADKVRWLEKHGVDKKNEKLSEKTKKAKKEFEGRMDDNLDTPQALAALYDLITFANKEIDSGKADKASMKALFGLLTGFNKVFDVLELPEKEPAKDDLDLIAERERLRKEKKFKEADVIRDTLRKRGLEIEDTPYGPRPKFRALKA
jgi:cysteinyl-tRNA synthetase